MVPATRLLRFASHGLKVTFLASPLLFFACSDNNAKGDSAAGGAATTGGSQAAGGNSASGGAASLGGATNGGTNGVSGGISGVGGALATGGANTGGAASGGANTSGSAGAGGATVGTCSPPADKEQPIARLSQTGCVDPAHPTQFASRVVPYEVNSPLWSDSADKARGLVLPPGGKIRVLDCAATASACTHGPADSGRWIFPTGSVMIKNFAFDGKLVETRLLVHFPDDTWVGYSYAWDEAQTDAMIVPNTRTPVTFNTGKRSVGWTYPSRKDCTKCHTAEGGMVLGTETAQMNRSVSGTNQIDAFDSLGLFEKAPAKPYQAALVTPYAGQLGGPPASATLADKARSYLHANCSFCHRPDGSGPSFDARNAVSFADTQMCNATPTKGDGGVPDALILTPEKPEMSVMYLRMKTEAVNSGRMPPLASDHADADGVKLIGDWITSIKACP